MLLESYVEGRWRVPDDEGLPLRDAATGALVARVSGRGVDTAAALEYARDVGGPALRALTFHERGALLKAVAAHLTACSEELYALSSSTGATKPDSDIDVAGGIGTLFAYASRARRELPNDTVYVEGPVEALSRKGGFVGQHLCVPLRGVAVQVNAYNFPVWGMLGKLAPAIVAGVPALVKPASATAYLTERVVRRVIESGILPEGALSLVCGSAGGLLDHLGGQDLVGFTGSAATAQLLRAHPAVTGRGVRFNAEADSLNCCILGPDAGPGTPEFALFIAEVAREMTSKAGQKCTAVRRILCPSEHADAAVTALREALDKVVVGDPRDDSTTMGPLASTGQRDEVVAAVGRLRAAGHLVHGDGAALPGPGAFLRPVLLRIDDPADPTVHDVEAFGPVSSLIPYATSGGAAATVVALAARGQGSLVGSVVSHDPDFVREAVLGAAAFHGRLLVLDRDCAAESTGHGSPLPGLVHGGPGRAGGGEELGGLRGVLHHLQRTAVQGSPAMLTAVTGRWVAGSPRRQGGHPFRLSLDELQVGDCVVTGDHTVTQDEIDAFVALTGDSFYAHTDPVAAAANPLFGGIVAHGYLVLSLAAGLFVDPAPGPVLANYGLDSLRFTTPVKPGDTIRVTLTCAQKTPRLDADYGEVRWDAEVTDTEGTVVAHYELLTMVARAAATSAGVRPA